MDAEHMQKIIATCVGGSAEEKARLAEYAGLISRAYVYILLELKKDADSATSAKATAFLDEIETMAANS